MRLTCATYNILHGYHRDMILKNIRFLIDEGADAICLQEAEVRFEHAMREFLAQKDLADWEIRYAHIGLGGNVAILWNTRRLQFKKTRVVPLPKLRIPSAFQLLRGLAESINRVALIASFEFEGRNLQIVSAHIAWEGGLRHRMGQIRHLRDSLQEEHADLTILAGDFNTIAPRGLRRRQERRVEKVLGAQYINALPNLPWSYDISHADPADGFEFLTALHRAGVKFRTRLDYIFASNVSVVSGAMHDLPGSDHRPLVAVFDTAGAPASNTRAR